MLSYHALSGLIQLHGHHQNSILSFFPTGSPVFLTLSLAPAIETKEEIPRFAGSENQRPGEEQQNQLVYIL